MAAVGSGKVCIYGAGGPVGAAAARWLKNDYTLRLTDVRPIDEIAKGPPQSAGAPLPEALPPPHECRIVDVANYEQVLDAARGMDALINVTVNRPDPVLAFHVSLIGAYNVMKAAVACNIKRVIHTGPFHTSLGHDADYWYDFAVPSDIPLHPGTNLYALTKYLGGEVVRVFAERHQIETIAFLYTHFRPAETSSTEAGSGVGPFTTSWEDTGEAFVYGLRAPSLPRYYESFFLCADLPHGKFLAEKAKRLLGWEARHRFERLWKKAGP
jgi:nucleoside-diphosphate-sugar epimerase